MNKKITLEVFIDYICPFCYLGMVRIDELKKNHDIDIKYIQCPLHPDIPVEGFAFDKFFRGGEMDDIMMMHTIVSYLKQEHLPIGKISMIYNTRLAQELAKWADTIDITGSIHHQLFRSFFVDNSNLYDTDVLVSAAVRAGLSAEKSREVIEKRTFRDMVDQDWQYAKEMSVTSVPTFIAGEDRVVGFKPYAILERLVLNTQ